MKINLKEVSVFLSAILLAGSYAVAQNPYRWTDELELLKRVDISDITIQQDQDLVKIVIVIGKLLFILIFQVK